MKTRRSRSPGTTSTDTSSSDAVSQFTTKFTNAVAAVASRTSQPLLKVARAIVFAMVISVAAIAAITLLVVAFIRGIDTAVGTLLEGEIWFTYFICAGVFGLIGILLWSRRRPAKTKS